MAGTLARERGRTRSARPVAERRQPDVVRKESEEKDTDVESRGKRREAGNASKVGLRGDSSLAAEERQAA